MFISHNYSISIFIIIRIWTSQRWRKACLTVPFQRRSSRTTRRRPSCGCCSASSTGPASAASSRGCCATRGRASASASAGFSTKSSLLRQWWTVTSRSSGPLCQTYCRYVAAVVQHFNPSFANFLCISLLTSPCPCPCRYLQPPR